MEATILVISNNSVSSMGYSAGLFGYGYQVETMRTFEAAQVIMHSGLMPATIIIDVKYTPAEINQFITIVRRDFAYIGMILVVGQLGDHGYIMGANGYLPRPTNIETIVANLQAQ